MLGNWVKFWMVGLALAGICGAGAADWTGADRLAREAQSKVFAGKADEADGLLRQAEALLDAARAEPGADAAKLKSLETRLGRLRKDVDRKLAGPVSASGAPATAASQGSGAAPAAAMPSQVVGKLQSLDRTVTLGEGALRDGRAGGVQRALDDARVAIERWEKQYTGAYADGDRILAALKVRVAALESGLAGLEQGWAQAAAERARASAESDALSVAWRERFAPYLKSPYEQGHDPTRYFAAGYTADAAELNRRAALLV